MSKYLGVSTNMTSETHLVAALKKMGFEPEVHKEPVHLIDWHGQKRPDVATVVIPRRQIDSASNDIGFVKENGNYRAIISEYDSRSPQAKGLDGHRGYNDQWLGKLKQNYSISSKIAIGKAMGHIYQGTKVVGNKVQIMFAVKG